MKKYKAVENISKEDMNRLIFEFGEFHANALLKNGFNENTLPHEICKEENLMHLFKAEDQK